MLSKQTKERISRNRSSRKYPGWRKEMFALFTKVSQEYTKKIAALSATPSVPYEQILGFSHTRTVIHHWYHTTTLLTWPEFKRLLTACLKELEEASVSGEQHVKQTS